MDDFPSDNATGDAPERPSRPGAATEPPRRVPYVDDQSRVRRRERLAARRDAASSSGERTQHGRALRARAWATDRQGRFEQRLDRVRLEVERQERRRARLETAIVAGVGILGIAAAVVAGIWLPPAPAGLAGIGLVVMVLAGRNAAGRFAESRGPDAWDWQAGRYRAIGRPAARVQQLDQPDPGGRGDRRR